MYRRVLNRRRQERFGIALEHRVHFVHLRLRPLVEDKRYACADGLRVSYHLRYPRLTLLLQSLGSVLLGAEALLKLIPDVYFDTMGYAFTYPLFKLLGGCRVVAYVHYPTISSDMLGAVASNAVAFNNNAAISRSIVLTRLKLMFDDCSKCFTHAQRYYRAFAWLYGVVGRRADLAIVSDCAVAKTLLIPGQFILDAKSH
jgi:alpha-1,2-mannosyltransferase